MENVRKRFLAGFLALVMVFSFLPAQAFAGELEDETIAGTEDQVSQETPEDPPSADEEDPPEGTRETDLGTSTVVIQEEPQEETQEGPQEDNFPYYLLITHSMKLDGTDYSKTEMVPLMEGSFRNGVYDFHQNALDRTGMAVVRGSYQDKETYDLVESWTVAMEDFEMGGDPDDGSAYYAVQLLIEYEVANGYTANVSNASGRPGEYDAMPLAQFSGASIDSITFTPADVVRLTINFEYSRTGGMAGASAADSVVIEVTKSAENENVVTQTWDLPSYSNDKSKYESLQNFRIVLDPAPLNAYLVDPGLAEKAVSGELTQAEIEAALERGDFNVQISDTPKQGAIQRPGPVYWVNDKVNNLSGSAENKYGNRYSYNYNEAWNNARSIGNENSWFTASATPESGTLELVGANAIENPQLTVTISEAQWNAHIQPLLYTIRDTTKSQDERDQAQAELDAGLTVTVYYRRNASFYNVEHWVPKDLAGDSPTDTPWQSKTVDETEYCLVFTEQVQGRVGALTNAKDSPERGASNGVIAGTVDGLEPGTNSFDFSSVVAKGISQLVIAQRDENGHPQTTVRIYYEAAEHYRVIFDTNDAYIPRQQVRIGTSMKFDYDASGGKGMLTLTENGADTGEPVSDYRNPTRAGYKFAGWGYLLRDGVSAENNDYKNDAGQTCRPLPADNGGFTIQSIISTAYITNSETGETGVKALLLYPIWVPDKANVRVVFWTEDLMGGNGDVSKEEDPSTRPDPTAPKHSTNYSNVGSFTFTTDTGIKLLDDNGGISASVSVSVDNDSKALSKVIEDQFKEVMGSETYEGADTSGGTVTTRTVYISDFYSLDHTEVSSSARDTDNTVAADGSTVLYVYYTRNIYTLEFQYYTVYNGNTQIAYGTNGYANGQGEGNHTTPKDQLYNRWQTVTDQSISNLPTRFVTIKAKYGADLRDYWPQNSNSVVGTNNKTYQFVSWSTTEGPYNAIARGLVLGQSTGEPTIMGVYASMSWQLVADAKAPQTAHELYAYWTDTSNMTYYTYNHCLEIPGLNPSTLKNLPASDNGTGFYKDLYLAGGSQTGHDEHDMLYLIPVTNSAFDAFDDLLPVNANGEPDEQGSYYAVRIYTFTPAGGTLITKCYALGQQVNAISSAKIAMQNPSDRPHMTRINESWTSDSTTYPTVADHTTEYNHSDGNHASNDNTPIPNNTKTNPYALYFYYDRDRYKIIYTVPVNNGSDEENGTDRVLGTMEVLYGTTLDRETYGFELDHKDKNDTKEGSKLKYSWELKDEKGSTIDSLTVCPDRSTEGTAEWSFDGWFLDRALKKNVSWDETVTGNVRLYAGWNVPTYDVTFHLGGTGSDGTGGIDLSNNQSWEDIKLQKISANTSFTGANGIIPRPTRDGFTLVGWYVAYGNGTATDDVFDFDAPITKAMHVTAKWDLTGAEPYYYKVWHLTEDPTEGTTTGKYTGTPKNSEGNNMSHTGGKDTWYILGGEPVLVTDYKNTGDVLWLAASAFSGYVPLHPNHSYAVNTDGNSEDIPAEYFFYYTKAVLKEYTLNFVLAGTETNAQPTIAIDPITGEATVSVLQPSFSNFEELKACGYQLVNKVNDEYVTVKTADDLVAFKKNVDDMTATYLVQPIEYSISYNPGTFKMNGTEVTDNAVLNALQAAISAQLTAMTETNKYPEDVTSGSNPGRYNVQSETFTLENPESYVRVKVGDGEYQWWKFNGWSLGGDTKVAETKTARDASEDYDAYEVEVDKGSVGNLEFLADWVRVDNAPALRVSKTVESVTKDVTAPTDDEFSFTATLANGKFPADTLMYKVDKDGVIGERETITSDSSVTFTLKAGEKMEFDGLPNGAAVTVTEITSGSKFDAENEKNYYTVNNRTATGSASVSAAINEGSTATAAFTNYYHATVWLDTDPSNANTNESFEIEKILLEDGTQRSFFGGNKYYILIRAGAQSDSDTPLPNDAADGNYKKIALSSTSGAAKISSSFSAVRFEQPGTYTYVISEERPNSINAVPGVSYDETMYRVTVVVKADNENLTASITKLETRDIPDSDGGVTGWSETPLDDVPGSLKGKLLFQNTYNTALVHRAYTFEKELTGNRPDSLQAGEFIFTMERAGSHVMQQNEATEYHTAGITEEARLAQLKGFTYTHDDAQRLPSGVNQETGKVTNGEAGTITFGSLDYTADNMGGNAYGKVYKYTITEDLPDGITDGKYEGITYDESTKELYVYVHLHNENGALAQLGDSDTLVYADVLGDRNGIFENTYSTDPITVDLGGGPDDPDTNTTTASITKIITGRSFQAGDEFTFTLTPADEETPMPRDDSGNPLSEVTVTIHPTSGNSWPVDFEKAITFETTGIYEYTLVETPGSAASMTYDTDEKALTIRVYDDGEGRLKAEIEEVTWTNKYSGPGIPSIPDIPSLPIFPDVPSIPSTPSTPSTPGVSAHSTPEKPQVTLDTTDHFAYIVGKDDGLVHPNDCITRAEVATIFYRLLTEESRKVYWIKTNPYPDVQTEDWFNVAVSVISNAGIINGYDNGNFGPNNNITRAEFATIAARFLSDPYAGADYYTDISGHWAREYINRAAAAGWVSGIDIPFRPDDYITRAEVMTVINAMIGRTPDKDHMHGDMIVWPDNMDTTKWYYEAVQEATNSHEYVRIADTIEDWTDILPVRNWTEIEQAWSDIYDSVNPGDVIDSGL